MVTEIWVSRRQGSEVLPDHKDKNRELKILVIQFNFYKQQIKWSARHCADHVHSDRQGVSVPCPQESMFWKKVQLYCSWCELLQVLGVHQHWGRWGRGHIAFLRNWCLRWDWVEVRQLSGSVVQEVLCKVSEVDQGFYGTLTGMKWAWLATI